MKRRWHTLNANKSTRCPLAWIFVDTETKHRPYGEACQHEFHSLMLGHAIGLRMCRGRPTRQRNLTFQNHCDFWRWVIPQTNDRYPVWICAHNAGFDFSILHGWTMLPSFGFRLTKCILECPPVILHWRLGKRKIIVVDSLNWFRCSLSTLGESVGLLKFMFPNYDDTDDVWERYCIRDCEIVKESMVNLMQWNLQNDLGVFRPTAPSQAMQAYRHRFMQTPIQIHDHKGALNLERKSYYGGQTSCFYRGVVGDFTATDNGTNAVQSNSATAVRFGPVYHLDVNSLYPSVMRANVYPIAFDGIADCSSPSDLSEVARTRMIIASVQIKSDMDTYPVRTEHGTLYATGQFWTVLADPELRRALRLGHVKKAGTVAYYRFGDLFTEYIDYFWQLRQRYKREGNSCYQQFCKLFMNSLFGKFGQHAIHWVDTKDVEPLGDWGQWVNIDADTREVSRYRNISGLVQRKELAGESKDSFPGIAACVVSYGRCKMLDLIETAGRDNVLYMGLDSLHVTQLGLDNLQAAGSIDQDGLGQLRIIDTTETAVYRGIRDYTFGGERVIAGIPKTAIEIAPGQYRYQEFTSVKDVLYRRPPNGIIVRNVIRSIEHNDIHGKTGLNGKVIPPCLMQET